MMDADGFVVFAHDPRTAQWAEAARHVSKKITDDPEAQARNLRHGNTWFVGVDELPNAPDGSVNGVPLQGPWEDHVPALPQHAAQVSIIYPGYPIRDPDQSDANHRYRVNRMAAHVDGLLPEGAERRRYPRESHAYILGLPLNDVAAAPTVVWRGSHQIMQAALSEAIGAADPRDVDVTDAYHAARRHVFETCEAVPLRARPGQSFLIHRFALHGTTPWNGPTDSGRMIAFFRPEFPDPGEWLRA
ncbi:hypothetical protein [uncultured Tateyamaria sp.]|uniref:hypothetical protein n=1 Tax=uncultured Tateyamaria sp. TaxID=455651 RepID=UPI00262FCDA6|nr:hypothetical protein [uncultured Tateyamaria sp.]